MANKNSKKMNQKSEKSQKTNKIVKMVTIIIVALCVVAGGITTIVSTIKKKNTERTVRIAFYGLSEEYVEILKERIPVEDKIILKMDVLSEGAMDLAAVKEKYDMLFTWKGEVTDALEASSESIPAKILDCLPSSLRNKKCVPILLDHCELDYSKEVVAKIGKDIPTSYPGFLNYLNQAKQYVFSPFFCNGAEEKILTAFVGATVQAIGGEGAYNLLIDELRKGTPFETLLDVNLGVPNFTLRTVLDSLKTWPGEGYTHPAWYNGRGNDLVYFAQDKQIGVFFTYLHDHRNIQYDIISQYDSFVLPPASSTIKFGIIAPAISGMLITDNSNAKRYLAEFFTSEAQEILSDKTRLAPVHARAQAYDRQADDVRFWAASCPAGAIPDIYNAAFQRNPDGNKKFADEIRNYIK